MCFWGHVSTPNYPGLDEIDVGEFNQANRLVHNAVHPFVLHEIDNIDRVRELFAVRMKLYPQIGYKKKVDNQFSRLCENRFDLRLYDLYLDTWIDGSQGSSKEMERRRI